MKRFCTVPLALVPLVAFLPNAASGQALPTATKSGDIQVGVAGMSLDNDYSTRRNAGIMVYGDIDFLRFFRVEAGLEAEARFGGIISPDDIGENSYLVGPRFSLRHGNFRGYGKVMIGRATIYHELPAPYNTSSSYNVFGYGGGLEYRVKERFNIRVVDFELQKWPDFEPHTLSPVAISVGLAYVIR